MKKLYLIGGTMGVGKTTVSKTLNRMLDNSVFLDGDWCWDAHPFTVTDETKALVMDNICHLLNNFIHCSAYENIVFCWVMHEQSIIDDILSLLDASACRVLSISLTCSKDALVARLEKDVESGLRTPDVIERSLIRLPLYDKLDTIKVDTTDKTVEGIAEALRCL